MKPQDFFTRPGANTSRKLMLIDPSGKTTDEFLMVLGTESDSFQNAKLEAHRRALEARAEGREHSPQEERARMTAALVESWSFSQEFSFNAVLDLITNAPYLADYIDRFTSRRSNFSPANS